MFEQDYIMRLIHEMVRAFLKLIFRIDSDNKEELIFDEKEQEEEEKYTKLLNLIDEGEINEAENKLLNDLNPEEIQYFKTALMFYSYLNGKDTDFLEEHDFSRKEIMEGLKHVSAVYGYESMAEVLLSMMSE
ncbi:DUF6483 family protein [Anaerocolumna jejuensis]|uniref:DUF6483 family protein n=1 Tax=Anaerocolumna jejuensis TaxID=259063 RepID=UPI003F7B5695